MKKLSILLIGLLLVASLGFAQDVTIKGSATLTWGVDLDNNLMNGFKNEASSELSVKWTFDNVAKGTQGFISLSGMSLTAADNAVKIADPTVKAGWMFAPVTITIYSAPKFAGGNAAGFLYLGDVRDDPDDAEAADEVAVALANKNIATAAGDATYEFIWVENDDVDAETDVVLDDTTDADYTFVKREVDGAAAVKTSYQGVTVGVDLGVATVDLKIASDGTWANSQNSYALGAVVGGTFGPASVTAEAWWGPYNDPDLAFSVGASAAFGPASVSAGYDVVNMESADASVGVGVDLGIVSLSTLTYIFSPDYTIDQEVVVSSSPIDGLNVTDTFQIVDLMVEGAQSFYNELAVDYTTPLSAGTQCQDAQTDLLK